MNPRTIIQSTKWSAITEILSKCLSPLINIFLARILTPQVFGLVAAFTIVTSLAETFTDAGFQKYLIQHEFSDEEDRRKTTDVAFWTNFILSCLVWAGIFVYQNDLAVLIGCPGYGTALSVISLEIPLIALYSIQNALYQRDFRFKDLLPIRLAGCLMPLIVTIPLALLWRNCWALIVGMLSKEIVMIMLLTLKSVWRPRLYYDFKRLMGMLRFSLLIFVDSIVVWFTGYAGTLIISRKLDLYHLGVFRTGQIMSEQYVGLLVSIVIPVFFASLSRIQNDREQCNNVYLRCQRYYAYAFIPIGIGMFVYRDFLVQLLLGSQWNDAVWIFGLWSLASPFVILTGQLNSHYYRALGRPGLALFVQAVYCIALVVTYWFTVNKSFMIFCMYAAGVRLIYLVVSTLAIVLFFKVSFVEMMLNLLRPTVGACIMAIFAWYVIPLFSGMIWTIVTVLMCIVVYFGVMSLSPGCRDDFKKVYGMFANKSQGEK